MLFQVTQMRRRGKALSQHELQAAASTHGDMVVVQQRTDALNRYSNIARFQQSGASDVQPIPELHDATLSWMGPNGFVLTGFEIVDGTMYGQSWWCRLQA